MEVLSFAVGLLLALVIALLFDKYMQIQRVNHRKSENGIPEPPLNSAGPLNNKSTTEPHHPAHQPRFGVAGLGSPTHVNAPPIQDISPVDVYHRVASEGAIPSNEGFKPNHSLRRRPPKNPERQRALPLVASSGVPGSSMTGAELEDERDDKPSSFVRVTTQEKHNVIKVVGGGYLPGIVVTLGGKWKEHNIIQRLLDDGKERYVFTLVDRNKMQFVKAKYEQEYLNAPSPVSPSSNNNTLPPFSSLVRSFNMSAIVQAISHLRLLEQQNTHMAREQLEAELAPRRKKLRDAVAALAEIGANNVYDDELDIIFSATMTVAIHEAVARGEAEFRERELQWERRNGAGGVMSGDLDSRGTSGGGTGGRGFQSIKVGIYSAGMAEAGLVTLGYIYLSVLGYTVDARIDLGVDNIKKTRSIIQSINDMDLCIVTAGMEAILPTVIANLCYRPVIAVPSSISYGFGAEGIAGMHSILMSDAPGIAVFNIGNIYGACVFAHRIGTFLMDRNIASQQKKQPGSVIGSPARRIGERRKLSVTSISGIPATSSGTVTTTIASPASSVRRTSKRNLLNNLGSGNSSSGGGSGHGRKKRSGSCATDEKRGDGEEESTQEGAIAGDASGEEDEENVSDEEVMDATNLFEPRYARNVFLLRDDTFEKIETRQSSAICDVANGVRISYPLLNLRGKSLDKIMAFLSSHKYVIVRDNRDPSGAAPRVEFSLQGFRHVDGMIYSNAPAWFVERRSQLYSRKHRVVVVCGGVSDMPYARECRAYLALNGIQCDILDQIDMNHVLLCAPDLEQLFLQYSVCVVIAGTNGTISNVVGGIFGGKPVVAVPVTSTGMYEQARYTVMSMLNNCVGGIAVVDNNNVYSAACLVLSILFSYKGDMSKLLMPPLQS